ncbi:GNAT family N-acetyltransferase [Devosia aurantiaca]|uniref:GNAT family N-acetyltransferase n=1 Tax=Devosia aurantiaca TaxID=2714858 RepID=A0A6M1ST84_9HYPH|nr:GNAT family N-acetyltransferase [Devosia aurantiaca]NGP17613.1 GNAT family N-acetyltransferase [Devosia aurantiaca]
MTIPYDIRPARKSDAAEIALLISIAVHGDMWEEEKDEQAGEVSGPIEVGRLDLLSEDGTFSWSDAFMAEANGEVAGMILGYRKPDARQPAPPNLWAPLVPLQELEAESAGLWYVAMLGVHKNWRSQGAGSALLEHADQQARRTNARGLALVVDDGNGGARKLYEGRGFVVRDSRPIVPFPDSKQDGSNWLLMVKE